ncbi:hypothetical protein [Bradyrhizobium sp. CCBAU 53351]|uniref:hypothetical protein n=1 Tax=Bradyrhizobium sp. CCBAU 53351 TaxID=1325114 RepID=UPI001886C975|nr:hypothetical protein [Bradyrhizobium sp. CCBAU 53351]
MSPQDLQGEPSWRNDIANDRTSKTLGDVPHPRLRGDIGPDTTKIRQGNELNVFLVSGIKIPIQLASVASGLAQLAKLGAKLTSEFLG